MQKLYVYSRKDFEDYMKSRQNGENYSDAYVSISNYDKKDHYQFDSNDEHSICLDFDDIDGEWCMDANVFEKSKKDFFDNIRISDRTARIPLNNLDVFKVGNTIKAFDWVDAWNLMMFIENNKHRDFHIHCEAGKSRSQAVARYIDDVYYMKDFEFRKDNPCQFPLIYVVNMLKVCYRFAVEYNLVEYYDI